MNSRSEKKPNPKSNKFIFLSLLSLCLSHSPFLLPPSSFSQHVSTKNDKLLNNSFDTGNVASINSDYREYPAKWNSKWQKYYITHFSSDIIIDYYLRRQK